MVTIIIISDDKTGNSQCYRDDEVDFADILTPNALKVSKVLVNKEKI